MVDKGLVLVTGATGFVGKWTVIELLKAGYPVHRPSWSHPRPGRRCGH